MLENSHKQSLNYVLNVATHGSRESESLVWANSLEGALSISQSNGVTICDFPVPGICW